VEILTFISAKYSSTFSKSIKKVKPFYALHLFQIANKFNNPNSISSYMTRYDFESRPDLVALFKTYQELLVKNDIHNISKLKVVYILEKQKDSLLLPVKIPLYKKVLVRIKRTVKVFLTGSI